MYNISIINGNLFKHDSFTKSIIFEFWWTVGNIKYQITAGKKWGGDSWPIGQLGQNIIFHSIINHSEMINQFHRAANGCGLTETLLIGDAGATWTWHFQLKFGCFRTLKFIYHWKTKWSYLFNSMRQIKYVLGQI